MHTPHVPGPCTLAREAQLQGLLARQDCNHKLQLSDKLHALVSRGPASQPKQRDPSFQFRLQASRAV